MHRELFQSALEMVVSEYRAADDGQRGVAADKVSGVVVHKVQKLAHGGRIDFHGRVLAVYRDAVLIEVRIGRELPEPILSVQRERHGAEILTVNAVTGIALVLLANHAGRIGRALGFQQLCRVLVVLFGL